MLCNSGNCLQISNDTIRIRDAVIEDIVMDRRNDLVTISYLVMENRNFVTNLITLIVGHNTIIRDRFGRIMNSRNLQVGMRVDAIVSTMMTRSIPPQTRAYAITVIEQFVSPPNVRTGTIVSVNQSTRSFTVGVPWDRNQQMVFNVSNDTVILAKNGQRIGLRFLLPGMRVRVEHADFQTLSIPPQTTAYLVQVL